MMGQLYHFHRQNTFHYQHFVSGNFSYTNNKLCEGLRMNIMVRVHSLQLLVMLKPKLNGKTTRLTLLLSPKSEQRCCLSKLFLSAKIWYKSYWNSVVSTAMETKLQTKLPLKIYGRHKLNREKYEKDYLQIRYAWSGNQNYHVLSPSCITQTNLCRISKSCYGAIFR